VRVLDEDGLSLAAEESGSEITLLAPAIRLQHPMASHPGERGSIDYAAIPRRSDMAPATLTVMLDYTGGGWRVGPEVPATLATPHTLKDHIRIERIGQTSDQRAFVTIHHGDSGNHPPRTQYNLIAITRDGRLLSHDAKQPFSSMSHLRHPNERPPPVKLRSTLNLALCHHEPGTLSPGLQVDDEPGTLSPSAHRLGGGACPPGRQ
jgi:hypothetical protein